MPARRKAAGKAWRSATQWVDGIRSELRDTDDLLPSKGIRDDRGRAVIDLKRLRDEPEYRAGIERKRVRAGLIDDVLAADDERRALCSARSRSSGARQNAASKEIGKAAPDERPAKIADAGALKDELAALEPELAEAEAALRELALQVPNPADASVPDGGEDDGDGAAGRRRTAGVAAAARPRRVRASAMGFVDTEQAAAMSGSRFAYLMREAVLLELALVQWVLGRLGGAGLHSRRAAGARARARDGGGRVLPDRPQPGLRGRRRRAVPRRHERGAAVGAAPRRDRSTPTRCRCATPGFSSNFRREAGTYGKDTRGIFRVHQFDKVEMFAYAAPDESWDEHERILAIEESIVGGLGLPYRVVEHRGRRSRRRRRPRSTTSRCGCPSEGRYRELTSCSNYRDFSARRLGTRMPGRGRDASSSTP